MESIRAVKFTPAQQQRYRQIGQNAAYEDPELGPILREWADSQCRTKVGADGHTYKIRDVWTYGCGGDGSRLITCQYAVKQPDGRVAWFDCPEGVDFADIEPFEVA